MAQAIIERRYTVEDLDRMPDPRRFELLDGELVELDMGHESNVLALRLNSHLQMFVDEHRLGLVAQGETTLDIFDRNDLLPRADGVYISFAKLPSGRAFSGPVRIVPDIVIEVVSPNDLAYHVDLKVEHYLEAGVPLVWVVWPETEQIKIHRPDGTVTRLDRHGTLSGEAVLPGFSLPLSRVFVNDASQTV